MIERRTFLQLSTLGLFDLWVGGSVSCTSTPVVVDVPTPPTLGASYGPKGRVLFCLQAANGMSRLRLFDWDENRFEDFPVEMGALHSVLQHPTDPSTLFLFELLGSAARLDWKSRSFIKIDHKEAKRLFNGHGAALRGGEFIATTEIDSTNQNCFVGLRSAENLSLVAFLPKECNNAHQVVAMPQSPLLAVGVMRAEDGKTGRGGITFYDTDSRQVEERIEFDHPILHLLPISSTEVIGVSLKSSIGTTSNPEISTSNSSSQNIATMTSQMKFEPSPLVYASSDGKKKTFWGDEDRMTFLYNFGLAKLGSNRFLSGHHDSGQVLLWENFKIKRRFAIPKVSNLLVSRDGKEFLALSGTRPMTYSLETFEPVSTFTDWPEVVAFSSYQNT